jgi:hypothetical protein
VSDARLPKPPVDVPANASPSVLAPRFRDAVQRVFIEMRKAGFDPVISESLRTPERQSYLFGFGRKYDDGRGIVTKAPNCDLSWHCFGLAVDVISAKYGWDAPPEFWRALAAAAKDEGLVSGSTFTDADLPHVQWGSPMLKTPSPRAASLRESGGNAAVWRVVGAA